MTASSANFDSSMLSKLVEQDINWEDDTQNDIRLPDLIAEINKTEGEDLALGKRKRDLLDKFENMYQKLGGSANIENPFEGIDPEEDISKLWAKLGNNKMLGILHAFVLLRPVIKEAIEREEHKLIESEDDKVNNESKLISDMAMKVDYLNSVVHSVVSRVNQQK